jgi:hypothetical protein
MSGLPDCEGWVCQSCAADNFIPPGFVRTDTVLAFADWCAVKEADFAATLRGNYDAYAEGSRDAYDLVETRLRAALGVSAPTGDDAR